MLNGAGEKTRLSVTISTALGIVTGSTLTVWLLITGRQSWPLAAICLAWMTMEFLVQAPARPLLAFIRATSLACVGIQAVSGIAAVAQGIWETPWAFNPSGLISARETLKIWLLYHGQTIYPLPGEYPFLVTLYTPIFFVLGAALNGMLHNPVASGMILTTVPYTLLTLLLLLWIRKEGGAWTAAFLAAAAFAASREMFQAGVIIRPDWLAWLLAYCGAYLFMTSGRSTPRLVCGSLLVAAALLTKQQTFPVALGLATVWLTDRSLLRRSLTMTAATCAAVLLGGGLTQWLSGGGFLIDSLRYPVALAANPDITNWESAVPRIKQFAILNLPALMLWAGFLIHGAARRRVHWLDWLLLLHIPFLLRLLMTWGASDNYFWGFMTALYARAGIALAYLMDRHKAGPSIAAFFFAAATIMAGSPQPHRPTDSGAVLDKFNRDKAVIARHDNGKDPILLNSELTGYYLPDAYDPRLHFFDSIESFYFELAGFWKLTGSRLESDIIARKFSTIVLGTTFINPALKDIVEYFYDKVHESEVFSIYRPRPGDAVLYRVPTDKPLEASGLRLQVTGVEGVEVNPGFGGFSFTRKQGSRESYVEFTLTMNSSPAAAHVIFHPKVASLGPGNEVFVEWAPEGGQFKPAFTSRGSSGDMSDRIGAFPAAFSVASPSRSVRFRFHPRGNGQIWFAPETPILFRVESTDK